MSHWSAPWMSGSVFGAAPGAVDPRSGVTWVMVPAGTVNVYSPKQDRNVQITLPRTILMSQTPVTQEQFMRVTGSNPSAFQGVANPVDSVVYGAAEGFCQRIGARLPSDLEFVYAAMGGKNKDPYGAAKTVAWFADNSGGATHPVGGKKPNGFGLYDMLGNVAVWTVSTRDGGRTRKVYGASWASPSDMVRATNNFDIQHRTESASVGFRCVMDYVPPAPTRTTLLEMEDMPEIAPPPPSTDERRIKQLELDGAPGYRSRRRR